MVQHAAIYYMLWFADVRCENIGTLVPGGTTIGSGRLNGSGRWVVYLYEGRPDAGRTGSRADPVCR